MVIEEEGAPIGFTLDDTKPDGTVPCIMGLVQSFKQFSVIVYILYNDSILYTTSPKIFTCRRTAFRPEL